MDGVRVISSLAVFIFLLLASFSAAREERSDKWEPVTEKQFPFLALVKTGADQKCAGSIPSKSTVLTYCDHAGTTSEAYAGLLDVAHATTPPTGNVQVRAVNSVAQYSDTALKICVVSDWELNDHVATVPLNLKDDSGPPTVAKCTVLGFRVKENTADTVAHKMEQNIGDISKCPIEEPPSLPKCTVLGFRAQASTTDTVAHKMERAIGGPTEGRSAFKLLYSKPAAVNEELGDLDRGGPAVCDNKEQWGISMKYRAVGQRPNCNLYIDIAKYREWFESSTKNTTDGQTPGDGGTGSLNHSKYEVLGFLASAIVIFLQYRY